MSNRLKVGLLGSGHISHLMAETLGRMDQAEAYAVASRSQEKADEFAAEFGVPRSYGCYEDLLNDPGVDLVYVATPHSHHYPQVLRCLEHNKPVLCEKAFTVNARQAKEVTDLAREKKLLLAEAIWTRYMPFSKTIRRLLDEGAVGNVQCVSANLGFPLTDKERMYKPELAGGALLDLGVYPLNFALMCLGSDVQKVRSTCVKYSTGVDAQNTMTLYYEDGRMATLYSTMMCISNRQGMIGGDQGFLVVDNINNPQVATLYGLESEVKEVYEAPPRISGYEYEVEACARALAEGAYECPDMPHSEIVHVMELMDGMRKEWGISYPGIE